MGNGLAGVLADYDASRASLYSPPGSGVHMPTLKHRLDNAMREAEARLVAVKEAREIFERNPDIERLLNIMQRGYF